MTGFRLFLIAVFIAVAAYSAIVGMNHGYNLLAIFFGDMQAMTWPGQFNLDFFCFLLLSGLWLAWRHDFSPTGLVLGLLGVFGGMLFLSAYLLVVIAKAGGDIRKVMLGERRAAAE